MATPKPGPLTQNPKADNNSPTEGIDQDTNKPTDTDAKDSRPEDRPEGDEDQTYIVHRETYADNAGVVHTKEHRIKTEDYAEEAAKRGW